VQKRTRDPPSSAPWQGGKRPHSNNPRKRQPKIGQRYKRCIRGLAAERTAQSVRRHGLRRRPSRHRKKRAMRARSTRRSRLHR
jgi:hypothetical protein